MAEIIALIVGGAVLALLLALWLFGERWRPLRPSSWRAIREAGPGRVLNLSAFHAYVYGRWSNQYVSLIINHINPRLGTSLRRRLANNWHGKVLTPELAKSIITLDHDIPHQDLEQIIPYPRARDLVLHGPPDVAVYECACRHARPNPCQPTQVCMVIGKLGVDFALEHNPQSSRRITQAEALEILQAAHKRGNVHTAWFRQACLDRFYALCNCCKCCCAGIEAMVKYGAPSLASSGFVAQVHESLCDSCGICEAACPFKAIEMRGAAFVDWPTCMGCGVCVGQCPHAAISLERDVHKGLPLDVRLLDVGRVQED